jgi:chitin disaccharide deacetylase
LCDFDPQRSNSWARCASGAVSAEALLIVNADDWGGFREGTDSIEMCFVEGAISSSTAMVHMTDAHRATELARENGRSIGLHLNFTQPFDALDVPVAVRERQRDLCAHFSSLGLRRWTYSLDPRVHRLIADGINDQLERFRETYATEPTHVDSHHHVHVCPDVFLSRALEPGMHVRQTLSRAPSIHPGRKDVARRIKHELLARRFITTDSFWRARELSCADHAVPIATAAELALSRSVEIMVHPSFAGELRVLCSDAWLGVVSQAPLGAYSAL